MHALLLAVALGGILTSEGPARAATCTITWTGAAGDGNWATPGNWTGNVLPGPADWACIPVARGW